MRPKRASAACDGGGRLRLVRHVQRQRQQRIARGNRFRTEAASREVATTASPFASAASAMRAPMPRAAPVIIQTRLKSVFAFMARSFKKVVEEGNVGFPLGAE